MGCTRNFQDPMSFWQIEQNFNPQDKNTTFEHLKVGFVGRFIESHRMMAHVNSRLKPDSFESDIHRPWHWPILYLAQPWFDTDYRIVLLGNPFIFLLNFIALLLVLPILIANKYSETRTATKVHLEKQDNKDYYFAMTWLLIAYLFHYIPFFLMHRILYYHHYFPALQFSNMLTAVIIAYAIENISKRYQKKIVDFVLFGLSLLIMGILAWSFYLYCFVGYGIPVTESYHPTNSTFKHLRFFDSWQI